MKQTLKKVGGSREAQDIRQLDKSIPDHIKPSTKNSAKQHSQTKVSYPSKLYCGRRKVVGIRVDENLYNEFKPVAKRVFGSVCRPIEGFMASVVALDRMGANFGNTIEVHEIKIERNLRARRGLPVEGGLGNFYDGDMWHRVDAPFNENNHGVGCRCRVCFGRGKRK